jgi:hypothetical protein
MIFAPAANAAGARPFGGFFERLEVGTMPTLLGKPGN